MDIIVTAITQQLVVPLIEVQYCIALPVTDVEANNIGSDL